MFWTSECSLRTQVKTTGRDLYSAEAQLLQCGKFHDATGHVVVWISFAHHTRSHFRNMPPQQFENLSPRAADQKESLLSTSRSLQKLLLLTQKTRLASLESQPYSRDISSFLYMSLILALLRQLQVGPTYDTIPSLLILCAGPSARHLDRMLLAALLSTVCLSAGSWIATS